MKRLFAVSGLLVAVLAAVGCSSKPPTCESPESKGLVQGVFWDAVGSKLAEAEKAFGPAVAGLSVEKLKPMFDISISQVVEKGYSEEKKEFTCVAEFALTPKDERLKGIMSKLNVDKMEALYAMTVIGATTTAESAKKSDYVHVLAVNQLNETGKMDTFQTMNVEFWMSFPDNKVRIASLEEAFKAISRLNPKNGAYGGTAEYTSSNSKVDGASRHLVSVSMKEPVHNVAALLPVISKFYDNAEQLGVVAKGQTKGKAAEPALPNTEEGDRGDEEASKSNKKN